MGWFHTHPSHGPFLSQIDLCQTHNVFFREPYQFALVIDPTTEDFDTGVYSWKSPGIMNNQNDSKLSIQWKNYLNESIY